MQLNSSFGQLLDILKAETSAQSLKASSSAPLTHASVQNLAGLTQVKALSLAIQKGNIDSSVVDQLQLHYHISQLEPKLLSTDFHSTQAIPPARRILECPRTDTVYNGARSTNAGGVQAWIEWKHERVVGPSSMTSKVTEVTEERLAALVSLLRHDKNTELFRVAPCLGYLREEHLLSGGRHGPRDIVYGIVFAKPSGCDSSTRALSLLELLEPPPPPPPPTATETGDAAQSYEGQNDGEHVPMHLPSQLAIPSVSKRVAMAKAITESVERLHAVNWLHKGIRSYNILFFPMEDQKETQSHALPSSSMDNLDRLDLSKPTLSGFESARPESESRWTEMAGRNTAHDLYRHPMLQQEGFGWDSSNSETARISFNKSFDVYSLGIVLLEIACWKPIHAILDINLEQAGLRDTMPVRRRLLEEPVHLARVRASVGDIMHAVIRACLEGLEQHGGSDLVDMNDPEYPLHFQEAFYEQVVRRLHTISV
jgi:hypothetical protein